MRGVVSWFKKGEVEGGYGFITPEEDGLNVFFHFDQIRETPGLLDLMVVGLRVKFTKTPMQDGRFKATNISLATMYRKATGEIGVCNLYGHVTKYNPTTGFGFIAPQEGGQDVLVHISAVQKAGLVTLSEGQTLYFDTELFSPTKRMVACNLRIVT